MLRCGIVLKPSTLLHFHHVLTQRKYHLLFSSKRTVRPGPKGPAQELIDAVVELKRRNPTWGCPRIAQQITLAFGVDIDKDVVRRILGKHYGLESGSGGPSWLTFLRAGVAEVSQHGPRSVVSVPPMAGQPASVGGDGNQYGTLRTAIASLCGAAC
jgi:hypothetical protein